MVAGSAGLTTAEDEIGEIIPSMIEQFAQAVDRFASTFDFGIPTGEFRRRTERIARDWRRMRATTDEAFPGRQTLGRCLRELRERAPKTYRKSVARIAALAFVHATVRSKMSDENAIRAIAATSLYEIVQDLLDDLLDEGGLTHSEARRLYARCLGPMTGPATAVAGLEESLEEFMTPDHDGLECVLAEAIRALRGLLSGRDRTIRRALSSTQDALGRGQAATTFLRKETMDLASFRLEATELPTPDPSLAWLDRLAISASWTSSIALIDSAFTEGASADPEFPGWAQAWLFFSGAVSYLEHMAGVQADLREGVFNVACIQSNVPSSVLEEDEFSGFDEGELQSIFDKATECLVRAVREGIAGGGRPEDYRFLALTIPALIFTIARVPEDQANAFLRGFAPAIRDATEALPQGAEGVPIESITT